MNTEIYFIGMSIMILGIFVLLGTIYNSKDMFTFTFYSFIGFTLALTGVGASLQSILERGDK